MQLANFMAKSRSVDDRTASMDFSVVTAGQAGRDRSDVPRPTAHEAGSRKREAGWPLHAVSAWLGHSNITTTARYLNVKDDYLQELIERKPLALVKS
jgi:hypothetical protein